MEDRMDIVTEIECVKCGVYVYVSVEDGRLGLVRGCSHYVVDSDLEYVRDEILEIVNN
jgi:hypothetical protein